MKRNNSFKGNPLFVKNRGFSLIIEDFYLIEHLFKSFKELEDLIFIGLFIEEESLLKDIYTLGPFERYKDYFDNPKFLKKIQEEDLFTLYYPWQKMSFTVVLDVPYGVKNNKQEYTFFIIFIKKTLIVNPIFLESLRFICDNKIIVSQEQIQTSPLFYYTEEEEELINKLSLTHSPILISGPTGIGKNRWAEVLHNKSLRNQGPYIVLNCANLNPDLIEIELFGSKKGAYTGAIDRKGYFGLAHGGTLVLDQIDALSLEMQVKFLRVLENYAYYPLGSEKEERCDIKIISLSSLSLNDLKKKLREDLWHRLNIFTIILKPLKEELFKIKPLVESYLGIPPDFALMQDLLKYSFSGNIRELYNILEQYQAGISVQAEGCKANLNFKDQMNAYKKELIELYYRHNNYNKTQTAKALGLDRTYLIQLMKSLKIE